MRMCQGWRRRRDINEHVKNSEPDKQCDTWLLFFSLHMHLSYIFYFKESTIITTEKQKQKTNTKKHTDMKRISHFQYCLTISFQKQSSSFFSTCLKLAPVSSCSLYN